MAEFLVEWSMSIYADDETGAAQEAWDALRRKHSIANVFEVSDGMGMTTRVDLDDTEVGKKVWMPSNSQIAELAQWMHDEGWGVGEIIEMIRSPHRYATEYSTMIIDREYGRVAKEPEELDDSTDETTEGED